MELSNRWILLTLSLGIFVYPAQRGPKHQMQVIKLPQPNKPPKHQYHPHLSPRGNNKQQVRVRAPRFQS